MRRHHGWHGQVPCRAEDPEAEGAQRGVHRAHRRVLRLHGLRPPLARRALHRRMADRGARAFLRLPVERGARERRRLRGGLPIGAQRHRALLFISRPASGRDVGAVQRHARMACRIRSRARGDGRLRGQHGRRLRCAAQGAHADPPPGRRLPERAHARGARADASGDDRSNAREAA